MITEFRLGAVYTDGRFQVRAKLSGDASIWLTGEQYVWKIVDGRCFRSTPARPWGWYWTIDEPLLDIEKLKEVEHGN